MLGWSNKAGTSWWIWIWGPYRNVVSLPDGGPHGQRGWGYTADAVQQREAGACTGGTAHLTGEHRKAAEGTAA